MKKLLVILISSFICLLASGDTGSLAASASSASFTNDGPHSLVYIQNVAVVTATAEANTYRVLVTKGSVDYQVATITTTTNSVYGNVVVTNPIPVGSDGVFKISRVTTGLVANVYSDIR